MEDASIIELFWKRSEKAISALADKYGALAWKIADGILHDPQDVEECMNDSYLGMWNAIPPKRPNILRAFFCKVTRNTALKRYRYNTAEKRRTELFSELDELCAGEEAANADLDDVGRMISEFLKQTDKISRLIFVRRYFMGDSVRRIAEIVGMSENAVSVRLSRTREKLKKYLGEQGIEL